MEGSIYGYLFQVSSGDIISLSNTTLPVIVVVSMSKAAYVTRQETPWMGYNLVAGHTLTHKGRASSR